MKKYIITYILILLSVSSKTIAQELDSPNIIIDKVVNHFLRDHNNFSIQNDVWGSYTIDLTLEAMLFYDLHTGNNIYTEKVSDIMRLRNIKPSDTISYRSQPFCSINYALYKATGNKQFIKPYVSETLKMIKGVKRTSKGAIQLFHRDKSGIERDYVLIDYIQEYGSRVARAGELTGNSLFFKESVEQFEIYRQLLRNPNTGLYSQGRGWMPDVLELSPGAWSRGHGWLIRGIVTSLESIPLQSEYYFKLQSILKELADDLLKVQDENGMWHQLLHLPFSKSYPESSSTGMIAYNLAIAYKKGFLKDKKYLESALLASNELKKYITEDGIVLGTCKGPGPLRTIDDYLNKPAKPGDYHGAQAIIYGMLTEIMLIEDYINNQN